jgi:hypothetical protein
MFSPKGGFEMKRLVAVVFGVLFLVGCGRSHETASAPGTDSGAPAAAAAPDLDGFEVEFPSAAVPARMAPGSEAKVRVEAKNVGSKAWPSAGDHPLVFGYHWEAPGADGNWGVLVWDDSSRATLQADVPPGETVVVTLPVKALSNPCPNCRLVIAPLLEMKTWSEKAKSITPVNIS